MKGQPPRRRGFVSVLGPIERGGQALIDLLIHIGSIVLLEINALVGKMGPIASVVGVIHMSVLLTAVIFGLMHIL